MGTRSGRTYRKSKSRERSKSKTTKKVTKKPNSTKKTIRSKSRGRSKTSAKKTTTKRNKNTNRARSKSTTTRGRSVSIKSAKKDTTKKNASKSKSRTRSVSKKRVTSKKVTPKKVTKKKPKKSALEEFDPSTTVPTSEPLKVVKGSDYVLPDDHKKYKAPARSSEQRIVDEFLGTFIIVWLLVPTFYIIPTIPLYWLYHFVVNWLFDVFFHGAHVSSSVTLATWYQGKLSSRDTFHIIFAQLAAGVFAFQTMAYLLPPEYDGCLHLPGVLTNIWTDQKLFYHAFLGEMIGNAIIIFSGLFTASLVPSVRRTINTASLRVALEVAAPFSGPGIALPFVIGWFSMDIWDMEDYSGHFLVYWIGGIVGSLLAVDFYRIFLAKKFNNDKKESSSDEDYNEEVEY